MNLFWARLKTIGKEPTCIKPHPTQPVTQLALRLYRLAHGCTFLIVGDVFGAAELTAHIIFRDICKAIVGCLYDGLVYLPRNLQEWSQELKNSRANWEFPWAGAWDEFHVYVSTKVENFYSYKKRYSVRKMGFIGYNMWAAVGVPGPTRDSGLLNSCGIYSEIESGHVVSNRSLILGPYGEIPFPSVGDSAFHNHSWLLKLYKEGTRVPSRGIWTGGFALAARVVYEHTYRMLKGQWRSIYKKKKVASYSTFPLSL